MSDQSQTTKRSTLGQRDVPLCRRGKADRRPKLRTLRNQVMVRARGPEWALTGSTMWRRANGR
jgi:hypothetical protein